MANCKSCGAEILWCETMAGKRMPVDAAPTDVGNLVVHGTKVYPVTVDDRVALKPTHTSHFATCKDADRHRKSR